MDFSSLLQGELVKSPTFLKLAFQNIGPDNVKELATFLGTDDKVEYLDLACNRIGDVGVKYLTEALKTNTTLQYLNISMNEITAEGAKWIARVLCENDEKTENKTLKHLDISLNRIGDEGMGYTSTMLRKNNSLLTLSLRSNKISRSGTGINSCLEILALSRGREVFL
jgi:Ran GTPase-activating protein (RanGAP) involved in mRNA processing and transport